MAGGVCLSYLCVLAISISRSIYVSLSFSIKVRLNPDCQVYKYKRTDATDVCPEIPEHIKVHTLTDSQEFAVDGAKVRIVHTPGHTTDHVVLTTEDGTLFSGDCILGEH